MADRTDGTYEMLYRQHLRISGTYRKALKALARLFSASGNPEAARITVATLRDADERVDEIRTDYADRGSNAGRYGITTGDMGK